MANKIERRLSIQREQEGYLSEQFSSAEADVTLEISILSCETRPIYQLWGYDKSGAEILLFEKALNAGEAQQFSYAHSFDPTSMAVYQNAIAFRARLSDAESAEQITLTLIEHEQDATTLAQMHRKIRGPRKLDHVLFVGNSILLGMENRYGMCSSAPNRDYFYHVSQAILRANPDCRFDKLHGSAIEHSESIEEFEDVLYRLENGYTNRPVVDSLTPDLDLIVLQITDNVNTEKKEQAFHHTAERLLSEIRSRCPHAEILWVYGWFYKSKIMPRVLELCAQYDVEPIDLRPLRFRANEAFKGMLYESADGTKKVVREICITHPGDSGMQAIAERIVSVLRETQLL